MHDPLHTALRRLNEVRSAGTANGAVSVALLEALDCALASTREERDRRAPSPSLEEMRQAVRQLDADRRRSRALGSFLNPLLIELVEAILDYPSRRLAAYGSLAPGEANHDQLADLSGDWADGFIRGTLHRAGWGAGLGYPGLVWHPTGERIPVRVFRSEDLPEHWSRLDAFEGPSYSRILVPVEGLGKDLKVCNLYAVREEPTTDE